MKTSDRYTYRVFFSPEDGEYVGRCAELPGLSWLARTAESALRGIRKTTEQAVEILAGDGDVVPEPIAARPFSGIFKVRVPPEVHRQLALDAAEQGVSMNRLVSAKLSRPGKAGAPGSQRTDPGTERTPRARRVVSPLSGKTGGR